MAKITKIEIRVGTKTIRITTEQAMALQAELNMKFPVLAPPVYPQVVPVPYPVYPQPNPYYYKDTYPTVTWEPNT